MRDHHSRRRKRTERAVARWRRDLFKYINIQPVLPVKVVSCRQIDLLLRRKVCHG